MNLLPTLNTKAEIDHVIRMTHDKVLVLRFGIGDDIVTMQQDDIVSFYFQHSIFTYSSLKLYRCERLLSKMSCIYTVDVNAVPLYTEYFEISLIPATIFFFNATHMKVDYR